MKVFYKNFLLNDSVYKIDENYNENSGHLYHICQGI